MPPTLRWLGHRHWRRKPNTLWKVSAKPVANHSSVGYGSLLSPTLRVHQWMSNHYIQVIFPTPVAFIKIFPHVTRRLLWLHNNMNSSVLDLCFLFVTLIRTTFSELSSSKHSSASECRPRSTWNIGYCCCSGWHATWSTNTIIPLY